MALKVPPSPIGIPHFAGTEARSSAQYPVPILCGQCDLTIFRRGLSRRYDHGQAHLRGEHVS